MLFEDIGPVRTRKVPLTGATKGPGIEVRQKLGQEAGNLEHGFRIVAF